MNIGPALKALRAEATRLAAAGSRRLQEARRTLGDTIVISASFDEALIEELRVKAAIAVLTGGQTFEIPRSLHGHKRMGATVVVDPEQHRDMSDGTVTQIQIPEPIFGRFEGIA